MGSHRVVITGIGVVSAIGRDRESFWESLCAARHGFAEITLCDTSTLQFHHGGEVRDVDLESAFAAADAGALDRFARLWMLAAREAVASSGIERASLVDASVVTGTAVAGQTTQDEVLRGLYRDGRRRLTHVRGAPHHGERRRESSIDGVRNRGAGHDSIDSVLVVEPRDRRCILDGVARRIHKVALTGGSEAPFSLGHLKAWDSMRVISPDLCRPFSRDRKGMILAEGAGSARSRRARDRTSHGAPIIHAAIQRFSACRRTRATLPSHRRVGRAGPSRVRLSDASMTPDSVDLCERPRDRNATERCDRDPGGEDGLR